MTCRWCGEDVPFEPTTCSNLRKPTLNDYKQLGRYIAPNLDNPDINKPLSFIDLLDLSKKHPEIEPVKLIRKLDAS